MFCANSSLNSFMDTFLHEECPERTADEYKKQCAKYIFHERLPFPLAYTAHDEV